MPRSWGERRNSTMHKLQVRVRDKTYPIYIENHILDHVQQYIADCFRGKRIILVSDDQVFPRYGEKMIDRLKESWECHYLVVPHGEETKSFRMLPKLYEAFLEAGITRSDLVIALGGGVVGDLAGFAAATYLRGVKFVQIPTSLLAQVDSSVGGKVAVDLPEGKNLVGAFYHPELVLIDPAVLESLPERYLHDGMGEVIKYGFIEDRVLYRMLQEADGYDRLKTMMPEIIYRCVDCKRRIVEEDEFDFSKRMLLNFGHTLAHTIEQHYQYGRESHGEAVAVGMYQITRLAEEKGLTEKGTKDKIRELLDRYRLPHACDTDAAELLEAIARDKKNIGGHLHVVLLHSPGDSYIYETDLGFFRSDTITRF